MTLELDSWNQEVKHLDDFNPESINSLVIDFLQRCGLSIHDILDMKNRAMFEHFWFENLYGNYKKWLPPDYHENSNLPWIFEDKNT